MQPVTSIGHKPKRVWVRIAIAVVATVVGAASEHPEALLIACALWMSVVSEWSCAQPAYSPRRTRTRRPRPTMRDSWVA
jgi:hypothetical protein